MKKIYLDHAATTPVDKKVMKVMAPYFSDKFGNASSLHSFGKVASDAVEKARKQVADFFGADKDEVIFTSGATESNNLAIKGVVDKYYHTTKHDSICPHIITTSFEHHCVLNAVKNLEKERKIEATFITSKKDGVVQAEDIKKAIKPNTILVSVMYVNNEIGTIQPIKEIGKILQEERRKKKEEREYPLFHTDATQAISYFDCNVEKLGVDMLSMSAHKIYGPKGVGVLYIKKGMPIKHIQDGGEQEFGMRPGTLNVPVIIGLGEAIKEIQSSKFKVQNKGIKKLRDYLIKKVLKEIPMSRLNGSKIKRSPNNANFGFRNVEGESLLMMLDNEGIAGSTGSACSSGTLEPSHVLLSIGLKPEEAHGSLRLTLGKHTTKKEIDYTIDKLKKVIKKLRSISGDVLSDYYKK